ncbi:DUF4190 domain-containing protein [Streptomyces kronopolitis]|uniref:DUF4190 domain-containing protein n=1 Tax=Streptomyces kronopolitis TaxID=1612435 RepID=A0ABQ2IXZ0_9ACTN|nr:MULTISPECIES: DUF4190 domain-containing protein [Streptomyces]MCL6298845.1 DUF4190 domain-containing protein [Streptomyces kronopolitis]GGN34487.1 hypothetical protein GCM10012285_06590 [Streptomyces kronopolitis]GLW15534.1 hypothetical protein Stsp01_22770 [Streptomyces sp. NBRC 13847]
MTSTWIPLKTGPRPQADRMAVAAFVCGLVGTVVFNVFFGPCAVLFGILALARGTIRRLRAWLGIAFGVLDLVLLFVLTSSGGTVSWHL